MPSRPPIRGRRSHQRGIRFVFVLALLFAGAANAQEARIFQIATGDPASMYYFVGGMVAGAISNPPGSGSCDRGDECGVPNLVAIAQSAADDVTNLKQLLSGEVVSGFVRSDIAYEAFTATGRFAGQPPASSLRAIAGLYPEIFHLVARVDVESDSILNLRGRRLSLDWPGSPYLKGLRHVLDAVGLSEKSDIDARYLSGANALKALKAGQLDGFFVVGGFPLPVIEQALTEGPARLIPLSGKAMEALLAKRPYLARKIIPAGVYTKSRMIRTIGLSVIWLVNETADPELIFRITRTLWNKRSRDLFDASHQKGGLIRYESALDAVGVPLHPGAVRFYRKSGLLK